MLKRLSVVLLVLAISLVNTVTFGAASLTTRNDDFEGFPTGSLDLTNNLSLQDGTLFKSTTTSASYKGGWSLSAGSVGTGTKFSLVQTTGKSGTTTNALKIYRDTVNSTTGIFSVGTSGTFANNGKIVWEANLRNGGDGNADIGSILIDKVRYYPALGRMDFIRDDNAVPNVLPRNSVVSVSTSAWFKFRYEVNYQTDTVSIYINDVLKASQKYGGRYATQLTNSNLRFYVESGAASASLPGALFVDDVNVYSPTTDKTLALVSSTPTNGQSDVAVNQPISLKFSKSIQSATLSNITVKEQGSSTPLAVSQIKYDSVNAVTSATLVLTNQLLYPKTYVVDLSGVLDIEGNGIIDSNNQIVFTTHSGGKVIQRYDDFEGYNTGNIWMDTKVINSNPPSKTEDGVTYAINSSSQTPKLNGAFGFAASKTGCEVNLVKTVDNNNNQIQALQSINKDGVAGYGTQITLNGSYNLTDAKVFVYKARIRGGNSSDESAYYTNIGNARVYYGSALRTLGGIDTDGVKNYYNVIPANGTWFDVEYVVDLDSKIILIYINNTLIATQTMPDTMALPSVTAPKLQDYSTTSLSATYIDKIEIYTLKQSLSSYPTIPTFLSGANMIDKLSSGNLGTLTGKTYYVNKEAAKNVTVVYALYYDESLVGVTFEEKPVLQNSKTVFDFSYTPTTMDVPNYKIKTFFLDGIDSIKPVYKNYTVSPTGCGW